MDAKIAVVSPATTKIFLINSSLMTLIKDKFSRIKIRDETDGIKIPMGDES